MILGISYFRFYLDIFIDKGLKSAKSKLDNVKNSEYLQNNPEYLQALKNSQIRELLRKYAHPESPANVYFPKFVLTHFTGLGHKLTEINCCLLREISK